MVRYAARPDLLDVMAESTPSSSANQSSVRLWIAGIAYLVFGVPLVFFVSFRVLSAPILAISLLDPPAWFETYVVPVFAGASIILSLAAVYYGWRIVSAQLRRAA